MLVRIHGKLYRLPKSNPAPPVQVGASVGIGTSVGIIVTPSGHRYVRVRRGGDA